MVQSFNPSFGRPEHARRSMEDAIDRAFSGLCPFLSRRVGEYLAKRYPDISPDAYAPYPLILSTTSDVAAAGALASTVTIPTLTLFYAIRTSPQYDFGTLPGNYFGTNVGTDFTFRLLAQEGGYILGTITNPVSSAAFHSDQPTRVQPWWSGANQTLSFNGTNNEPIALTLGITLYGIGIYTAAGPVT